MENPVKVDPINSLNDFVIKFANVNGTGSASANQMFASLFLGWEYRLVQKYFSFKYPRFANLV